MEQKSAQRSLSKAQQITQLKLELSRCKGELLARNVAFAGIMSLGTLWKLNKSSKAAEKELAQAHTAKQRSEAFLVLLNSLKEESDKYAEQLESYLQETLSQSSSKRLRVAAAQAAFQNREHLLNILVMAEQKRPGILYSTFATFLRRKYRQKSKSTAPVKRTESPPKSFSWEREQIITINRSSRSLFHTMLKAQPAMLNNIFFVLQRHAKLPYEVMSFLEDATKERDIKTTLDLLSGSSESSDELSLLGVLLMAGLSLLSALASVEPAALDQLERKQKPRSPAEPELSMLIQANLDERMEQARKAEFTELFSKDARIQELSIDLTKRVLTLFPNYVQLVSQMKALVEAGEQSWVSYGIMNVVSVLGMSPSLVQIKVVETIWRIPAVRERVLTKIASIMGYYVGYPEPSNELKERFVSSEEWQKSREMVQSELPGGGTIS